MGQGAMGAARGWGRPTADKQTPGAKPPLPLRSLPIWPSFCWGLGLCCCLSPAWPKRPIRLIIGPFPAEGCEWPLMSGNGSPQMVLPRQFNRNCPNLRRFWFKGLKPKKAGKVGINLDFDREGEVFIDSVKKFISKRVKWVLNELNWLLLNRFGRVTNCFGIRFKPVEPFWQRNLLYVKWT